MVKPGAGNSTTGASLANLIGVSDLDLPWGPQPSYTGFYFIIDTDTKEYVIKNYSTIGSAQTLVCQIVYNYTPSNLKDGFERARLGRGSKLDEDNAIRVGAKYTPATPEGGEPIPPFTKPSNPLDLTVNTFVRPGMLDKTVESKHETWQDSWGDKPADAADYYYVVWRVGYYYYPNLSTQPYTFSITDHNYIAEAAPSGSGIPSSDPLKQIHEGDLIDPEGDKDGPRYSFSLAQVRLWPVHLRTMRRLKIFR